MTGTGLQFLGLPAMMGRNFLPSDAPDGQEPQQVVVLSNKFWRRHFNGDLSVAGKSIQLAHKTYTILGVLPPRFTWRDGDVYLPLNLSTSPTIEYGLLLKLRPGTTQAAAATELEPFFQQFAKETPNHFPKQFKLVLRNISYRYLQQLGGTLALLFAAVGLLLAIGCAWHSPATRVRGPGGGGRKRISYCPPAADGIAAIGALRRRIGGASRLCKPGLDRGPPAGILLSA